jgi:hypothetical protein
MMSDEQWVISNFRFIDLHRRLIFNEEKILHLKAQCQFALKWHHFYYPLLIIYYSSSYA